MSWTVAFALLGALIFSMLLAPVLASFLFRNGTTEWENPLLRWITNRYRHAATWAIEHRVDMTKKRKHHEHPSRMMERHPLVRITLTSGPLFVAGRLWSLPGSYRTFTLSSSASRSKNDTPWRFGKVQSRSIACKV